MRASFSVDSGQDSRIFSNCRLLLLCDDVVFTSFSVHVGIIAELVIVKTACINLELYTFS